MEREISFYSGFHNLNSLAYVEWRRHHWDSPEITFLNAWLYKDVSMYMILAVLQVKN